MPGKRSRKEEMMRVAQYPLDWLEERSGLLGGVKYFLFRKVPRDSGWWHTLGSATLTAFLVQLGTGASARIKKYTLTGPGQHVAGVEGWLYPWQPPH